MQDRRILLEKIAGLKIIESTKLEASKDKTKIDLHDQKHKGLEMMESSLQEHAFNNITQTFLREIIAAVVKRHPRFAEGFNSKIKKFLNEYAPGWNVSVGPTLFANPPEAEDEAPKPYKICVLGDYACGKTSIIDSLVKKTFLETYKLTLGVTFISKEINGMSCDVWDVPGHERFGTMLGRYLRDTSAIIFVFDITRPYSFESIDRWCEAAKNHLGNFNYNDLPKMLVVNKIDMKDKVGPQLIEKAREYAAVNGMQFAEVAANNHESVSDMFNRVALLLKAYGEKMMLQEESNEVRVSSDENVLERRRENCVMM